MITDPSNPHFFVRDTSPTRTPVFVSGLGGPEMYLSNSFGDSNRTKVLNALKGSANYPNIPTNAIYFHAMRAFGGDGSANETPFNVDSDPNSGLSPSKMTAWRASLKQLDDAGIVIWFNLLDDHSAPYGCQDAVKYPAYATALVSQFRDLKNVIWSTQEEFDWSDGSLSGCSSATNKLRQDQLAQGIYAADTIHTIGTHNRADTPTDPLAGYPHHGVYGQQTAVTSVAGMHDTAGARGWSTGPNNAVYVMAEAEPWHRNLLTSASGGNAGARTTMRQSHWATAMSGAGGVLMYNSYEQGAGSEPTVDLLDDMRRLRLFMESTRFQEMTPLFGTALSNVVAGDTKYVMANQTKGLYILYSTNNALGTLGVKAAPAGTYDLKWYDPVTGASLTQTGQSVPASGAASFVRPSFNTSEVVLYMIKL